MGKLRAKDFLTLQDFSAAEIETVLTLAGDLKARHRRGEPHRLLEGKTLGMIFQKPSTRTRVSFEAGMWQLGGHALFLSSQELQLGRGEPVRDTAEVLSRYLDAIMIRTFDHGEMEELAAHSSVPVINGLTDLLHPCQVLSDLFTIQEHFGYLRGLKVAYMGDGNNVAHSLLLGCSLMGVHISVGSPPGFEPREEIEAKARQNAALSGSEVLITSDPARAVEGAAAVYTDVWASMGQEEDKKRRLELFKPYQVNGALLQGTGADAVVLHCLPAYRGEEITAEVLEGESSLAWEQAENRMHAQKALLVLLIKEREKKLI